MQDVPEEEELYDQVKPLQDTKQQFSEARTAYQAGLEQLLLQNYENALDYLEVARVSVEKLLLVGGAQVRQLYINIKAKTCEVYIQMGYYQEAIEECNAFLHERPNHVSALMRRALSYSRLKMRWEAYRDAYRAVICKQSTIVTLLYSRTVKSFKAKQKFDLQKARSLRLWSQVHKMCQDYIEVGANYELAVLEGVHALLRLEKFERARHELIKQLDQSWIKDRSAREQLLKTLAYVDRKLTASVSLKEGVLSKNKNKHKKRQEQLLNPNVSSADESGEGVQKGLFFPYTKEVREEEEDGENENNEQRKNGTTVSASESSRGGEAQKKQSRNRGSGQSDQTAKFNSSQESNRKFRDTLGCAQSSNSNFLRTHEQRELLASDFGIIDLISGAEGDYEDSGEGDEEERFLCVLVSAGEIKEVPIRRGTLYQYRQHVVDCDLAQRLGCSLKAVLLKRVSASEQQNLGVKPGLTVDELLTSEQGELTKVLYVHKDEEDFHIAQWRELHEYILRVLRAYWRNGTTISGNNPVTQKAFEEWKLSNLKHQ